MSQIVDAPAPASNLFGTPGSQDRFAAIGDPETGAGREALEKIAAKIGATRRPGAKSDIPAGATYLAQFVVHDLDFPTRETVPAGNLLDLGLIYGDGPKHDAFCYQVPLEAGAGRHLLRVGRARPTPSSPAWGAARDLPRTSCPHLDARPVETRSEVLVPNTLLRLEPAARPDADALGADAQRHRRDAGRDPLARDGLRARPPDQPRHLPRRDPARPARHLADAAVPRPLHSRRPAPAVGRRGLPHAARVHGRGRPDGPRARPRGLFAERPAGGHGACATSCATPRPAGRTTCR